jgi:hypothetical protein
MPPTSMGFHPNVYLLQKKPTKNDFSRESLKRGLVPLDEKLRNSLSMGGTFFGLGFGSFLAVCQFFQVAISALHTGI